MYVALSAHEREVLARGGAEEARSTLQALVLEFPEEREWVDERLAGIGPSEDQLELLRSLGYVGEE